MEELMIILKYAFLGALQGFTEPIPISSSGHLVLAQEYFGLSVSENDFSFEVLMNFASLLAVLLIYRNDLTRLTENGLKYMTKRDSAYKTDFMFIVYLIVGTIPAGVIGLLLEDQISASFRGIAPIGGALIVTGLALWLIRNLKGRKSDRNLTLKDALIVGFAQAVALIPGISRSGATIVAAMGIGMKRETALRFSFLLYIPVSLGTIVLKINDMNVGDMLIPYLIAFIFSFVLSYFSLKWFMGLMERGNLKYFAYYCFVVGSFILITT
ncbi:undecaprenyl-diphosphatase [Bacillus mesophilus]|uniref:Undecaprenyl-diphosphatase n=1 Tax=Bacillus mesophilus TaxID=1808955 RepID=A0A6M0QD28_9BACI|nr:undecaprenyl-diphosphate phosphatase [Bacillus mesophilus]MBM7663019.1 undecaprenyl-diphosphatase [Bacillus mesophilus]NEY73659.1 undecaprenyl-diphosphate phosphatase [Bacillus mesophilus]